MAQVNVIMVAWLRLPELAWSYRTWWYCPAFSGWLRLPELAWSYRTRWYCPAFSGWLRLPDLGVTA